MSVGHKIGLETAVSLTHACCLYRIPEPIRQVRNLRIENILSCELLLVVTMSLFSDTFCLKIPLFFSLNSWQNIAVSQTWLPVVTLWYKNSLKMIYWWPVCSPVFQANKLPQLIKHFPFQKSDIASTAGLISLSGDSELDFM